MALQGWREGLGKLTNLPSRKPPGRLILGDLRRLRQERETKVRGFREKFDELIDYAPLIGRRSMVSRVQEVTEAARVMLDFDVMLHEALKLHSKENELDGIGLDKDWLKVHQDSCWELGKELEEVARQALRH